MKILVDHCVYVKTIKLLQAQGHENSRDAILISSPARAESVLIAATPSRK